MRPKHSKRYVSDLSANEKVLMAIVRAAENFKRTHAAVFRKHGLSFPQYNVLRVLDASRKEQNLRNQPDYARTGGKHDRHRQKAEKRRFSDSKMKLPRRTRNHPSNHSKRKKNPQKHQGRKGQHPRKTSQQFFTARQTGSAE
jgi:hypothetical protein